MVEVQPRLPTVLVQPPTVVVETALNDVASLVAGTSSPTPSPAPTFGSLPYPLVAAPAPQELAKAVSEQLKGSLLELLEGLRRGQDAIRADLERVGAAVDRVQAELTRHSATANVVTAVGARWCTGTPTAKQALSGSGTNLGDEDFPGLSGLPSCPSTPGTSMPLAPIGSPPLMRRSRSNESRGSRGWKATSPTGGDEPVGFEELLVSPVPSCRNSVSSPRATPSTSMNVLDSFNIERIFEARGLAGSHAGEQSQAAGVLSSSSSPVRWRPPGGPPSRGRRKRQQSPPMLPGSVAGSGTDPLELTEDWDAQSSHRSHHSFQTGSTSSRQSAKSVTSSAQRLPPADQHTPTMQVLPIQADREPPRAIQEELAGSSEAKSLVASTEVRPLVDLVQPPSFKRALDRLRMSPRVVLHGLRTEQELKVVSRLPSAEVTNFRREEGLLGLLLLVPGWLLCFWGIRPFTESAMSGRYITALVLLTLLILGGELTQASLESVHLYSHLVTVFYALGGAIGLLFLRSQRIERLLGPQDHPLEQHAYDNGFRGSWQLASMRQFTVAMVTWAFTAVCKGVSFALGDCCEWSESGRPHEAYDALHIGSFIFVMGLFIAQLFTLLHICCGLELAIDNFCVVMVGHMDYRRGIGEWNVVQALLRRAAGTVDRCFLAMGTAAVTVLLWTGAQVLQGGMPGGQKASSQAVCSALWSGWILPPVGLLLYAVFRAAVVTELCARVPALLNSWALEESAAIDHDRQYTVQHITLSAAGFYVSGVRLSSDVAMKLTYLLGMVLFTLLTRAVLAK